MYQPQPHKSIQICAVLCKSVLGYLLNKASVGLQGGKDNQTSKQVYENGKGGFCEEKRQNSSEIKGKKFKPKNQKHKIIQINGKICF